MTVFNYSKAASVAIIGAGPAGLMAAEVLSQHGVRVEVYDAMPSVGRKFLMAGKGGMNITHAEPLPVFLDRYGSRREQIKPLLDAFSPDALREWIHGLGIDTFVGSSGRVFPTEMKAAPLLRAWLHRLRERGVRFHMRHRWTGWNGNGEFLFDTQEGEKSLLLRFPSPQSSPQKGERAGLEGAAVYAVVLALGGGSWPQLGSTGAWMDLLQQRGVELAPLRPANCGFNLNWSAHFKAKFAGQPLKAVVASFVDVSGVLQRRQGDCVITENGIEGGLIYALAAPLRDVLEANGAVTLNLDLAPGKDVQRLLQELDHPRGSRSISSHMQSRAGIKGVRAGLLRECTPREDFERPHSLVRAIKALPIKLVSARPLAEAISTAGGVRFEAMDEHLMLKHIPGVFCAGEMLDWEAPTGGYLLTACFASGKVAGEGVLNMLKYSI